jgi:hypothetical protein
VGLGRVFPERITEPGGPGQSLLSQKVVPMKPEDFTKLVYASAKAPQVFRPIAIYSHDGDCIKFFAKPDSYYRVRVDSFVTVYRAQGTDEIVGCLIKGISAFLKKCPYLKVIFENGKLKLEYFFVARLEQSKRSLPASRNYEQLFEIAKMHGVEANLEARGI